MKNQTIQLTDKKWKLCHLVGILIMIGSVGSCLLIPSELSSGSGGVFSFLIGGIVYCVGNLGKWWSND